MNNYKTRDRPIKRERNNTVITILREPNALNAITNTVSIVSIA